MKIEKAIDRLKYLADENLHGDDIKSLEIAISAMSSNHFRDVTEKVLTRNKTIELPCFVGDTVYYIQYPANAANWCKEKPKIVPMKVVKVTYEAQGDFEKIRVDTSYINKFGDDSYDWFIWEDGFLYTSKEEAEKVLKNEENV